MDDLAKEGDLGFRELIKPAFFVAIPFLMVARQPDLGGYRTLELEVAGVAALVSGLIVNDVPPGDILVLAQSRIIGTPLYEALEANGVPTKSYYAESELSAMDAQQAFALLKLFVNRQDRVALRWLAGIDGNNWHAAGYRRVREHCENTGTSPWDTMTQL